VLLSTTGRVIRIDLAESSNESIGRVTRRTKHDAILSSIVTTSRAEIGAITTLGRLVKLTPVDIPVVPENSIQLAAGVRISDYLALDVKKERVLALVSLVSDEPITIGTRQGIVKRVSPGDWPNRPDFDVIALKPGDQVIGATQANDAVELLFVSSDAQLLHFPASSVRPQGRSAGGMAGINLGPGAVAIFFGAIDPSADPVVATVSTSSATIAGTDYGRAKVSLLSEFPSKGRATGGVRAHAFLKGEDTLSLAWAGPGPAHAVGTDGAVRVLPDAGSKRDASGTPLEGVIGSIGAAIGS